MRNGLEACLGRGRYGGEMDIHRIFLEANDANYNDLATDET